MKLHRIGRRTTETHSEVSIQLRIHIRKNNSTKLRCDTIIERLPITKKFAAQRARNKFRDVDIENFGRHCDFESVNRSMHSPETLQSTECTLFIDKLEQHTENLKICIICSSEFLNIDRLFLRE